MQKIRNFTVAVATVLYLFVGNFPAKANPAAILAPAAFCAGTAGVGCVLLGAVIVGGVTYYLWESGGKKVLANANGQVLRAVKKVMVPDENNPDVVIVVDAKNWREARMGCARHFRRPVTVRFRDGKWYCSPRKEESTSQ